MARRPSPESQIDSESNTRAAIERLLQWYDPSSGLFATTGWWNTANIITILADFSALSPSLNSSIRPIFKNTFTTAQLTCPDFRNDFYDDEGWWALAWLKVFDLTQEPRYLQMSISIFEDMVQGWGGPCGGVWWNKTHTYTGAIENELFLATAAQLANRADNKEYYIQWALKQWAWFKGTGVINVDCNINNGIDAVTCRNDSQTVWTYNQGVILGALVELDKAAPNREYLETAESIALAAIHKLSDQDGMLHEFGEPDLGDDGPQFKGIFMRNLQTLQLTRPIASIKDFIGRNAAGIWHNRGANNELGVVWSEPTNTATAATQSSACDALIASLALTDTKST